MSLDPFWILVISSISIGIASALIAIDRDNHYAFIPTALGVGLILTLYLSGAPSAFDAIFSLAMLKFVAGYIVAGFIVALVYWIVFLMKIKKEIKENKVALDINGYDFASWFKNNIDYNIAQAEVADDTKLRDRQSEEFKARLNKIINDFTSSLSPQDKNTILTYEALRGILNSRFVPYLPMSYFRKKTVKEVIDATNEILAKALPIKASDYKTQIVIAATYWPATIISLLVSDVISKIFLSIWDYTKKAFDKISSLTLSPDSIK